MVYFRSCGSIFVLPMQQARPYEEWVFITQNENIQEGQKRQERNQEKDDSSSYMG